MLILVNVPGMSVPVFGIVRHICPLFTLKVVIVLRVGWLLVVSGVSHYWEIPTQPLLLLDLSISGPVLIVLLCVVSIGCLIMMFSLIISIVSMSIINPLLMFLYGRLVGNS